jgi:thiol-disulfide isomerase/thioredoxin
MKNLSPLLLALAVAPVLSAHAAPTTKANSKPNAKPAAKPAVKPATKPASKPIVQPAAKPAPQVAPAAAPVIDPAATAIIDAAIAAYKAPTGLSLKVESTVETAQGPSKVLGTLQWKAPNLYRSEIVMGAAAAGGAQADTPASEKKVSLITASDGTALYFMPEPAAYRRTEIEDIGDGLPPGFIATMAGQIGTGLQGFLPALLSGDKELIFKGDGKNQRVLEVQALPQTLIEGQQCEGVRRREQLSVRDQTATQETTAWFDTTTHALRSVEVVFQQGDKRVVAKDRIIENNFDAQFPSETFVWSPPPGAKESVEQQEIYWDPALVPGAPPHALTGSDLNGKPVSLEDYKGKVLLIDFWATWCGPCREEMPNVVKAYKKYYDQGFDIIGISLDETKNAVTSYIKANDMPWRQIYDGKNFKTENAVRYKVAGIPLTVLVGKDGKIAAVNARGRKLDAAIAAALAKPADGTTSEPTAPDAATPPVAPAVPTPEGIAPAPVATP